MLFLFPIVLVVVLRSAGLVARVFDRDYECEDDDARRTALSIRFCALGALGKASLEQAQAVNRLNSCRFGYAAAN